MTSPSIKSRVALVAVSTGLVVASTLGVIRGKDAHASFQATPYSQCSMNPWVPGSFFMVSIQNSVYDANSEIKFAQVFGPPPTNTPLGFWAVDNQSTAQVMINNTNVWVITAVFNPTLRKGPPVVCGPGEANEDEDDPKDDKKDYKKGKRVKVTPTITSGSTLCITTNVANDMCPTPPITINVVDVDPCP